MRFDGADAEALQRLLDLPLVSLHASVSSTMAIAEALANDGAPGGSLVLSDAQSAGRGRGGHQWVSEPGAGLWFSLIERLRDAESAKVLSLRAGLGVAAALDRHVPSGVRLKWPNDLFIGAGKVAGILTEARWQDRRPEWVIIGIGINVRPPANVSGASSLGGVTRLRLLGDVIPAVRAAASASGRLSDTELAAYAARDLAAGRMALAPSRGTVAGIDAEGHLLIAGRKGMERHASGSLVLEEEVA